MSIAAAAHHLNSVAYGYMSSWALLTACKERVFDRLPARSEELTETYPDADLVDTWMQVLAAEGLVERDSDGRWTIDDVGAKLLVGDDSYANYLGVQVLDQMTPRLTLGDGENQLLAALGDPTARTGYEGWFASAEEANTYQASQYTGSLLPGRSMARQLTPDGRVLDLGGGWGAIAKAFAERHDVDVDVVDLATVVDHAPPIHDRVHFLAGNALDPSTWPTTDYDGAVLSYLLSSVPGSIHQNVFNALAERSVRWVAVHDFMIDGGRWAAAWSLQHAVFVPGHVSRTSVEVAEMLTVAGFEKTETVGVVDEMTTMVIARR